MRISIVGGGPGGLYAALLLKQSDETRDVVLFDRNPPDATYGWGVVFSDETLTFLQDADPDTYAHIAASFVRWEAIDIFYRNERVRSGGHAFSGLSRKRLLSILRRRCEALGVDLRLQQEVGSADIPFADLVIAADGLNSGLRGAAATVFRPSFDVHTTRYIWFGVNLRFEAFTFVFRATEHGMFQVHAYPFDGEMSTFIVECTEATWVRADLNTASEADSIEFCSKLFADVLQGRILLSNRSHWLNFVTLRNENWRHRNLVLLGDAAHTAHFSIGSGTKMAMEDAIALSEALQTRPSIPEALVTYEELRQPVVERTQQAARDSSHWFENTARYASFEATQFAFSLLTRSKRITYDNLKIRDPEFIHSVNTWFEESTGQRGRRTEARDPAPMHGKLALNGITLCNRVTGTLGPSSPVPLVFPAGAHPQDFDGSVMEHGLLLTEIVAVSASGRITVDDPCLTGEDEAATWRAVVDTVHNGGDSKIGVQLGHAGRRGATRSRHEGIDMPLRDGAWPLLAASPIPYTARSQIPREMTLVDMEAVCADFVRAAFYAADAGFDVLQLHFGHGYLLAGFISPLTNRRRDIHGGELENRMRFPLRILAEVRHVWPSDRPLSVCFSATDWVKGGLTESESIAVADMLRKGGVDLLQVVSGQTTADANPTFGRMWQAQLSDMIRNEADVPTIVGGSIRTADEVNTILAAGRADLCMISST